MSTDAHSTDAMLSIVAFANRNGISRSQVYSEFKSGRLTARKLGKRVLISPEDEKKWRDSLPLLQPKQVVSV